MWKKVCLGALIAAWAAMAQISIGRADTISSCALPNGVNSKALEAAPPVLLDALKKHVGELVPPGGRFDATDVVMTGKTRRLIFVWNAGKLWIVATEHGGRGYNDPIFVYELSDDGNTATLVIERIAFPKTVCATAISLLNFEPHKP